MSKPTNDNDSSEAELEIYRNRDETTVPAGTPSSPYALEKEYKTSFRAKFFIALKHSET